MTKLTLALDGPIENKPLRRLLRTGHIACLKVGLWAAITPASHGRNTTWLQFATELCAEFGMLLFFDCKLADTPDTNEKSALSIVKYGGIHFFTIHSRGNQPEDLERIIRLCDGTDTTPIGLTVLTTEDITLDFPSLTRMDVIRHRVTIILGSGIKHIVCDGNNIDPLRRGGYLKGVTTHVPGVYSSWCPHKGDHLATITPIQARMFGVDYAILGRQILQPPNDMSIMQSLTWTCQELGILPS